MQQNQSRKELFNLVINELESNLKYSDKKRVNLLNKFNEDFCYELGWNGELLWKLSFRCKEYSRLIKRIESNYYDWLEFNKDTIDTLETLQNFVDENMYFLSMSYNVRENSTGSLHREVSTYKFQETMEINNEIKSIIKSYTIAK
jgi:hypothetical protein